MKNCIPRILQKIVSATMTTTTAKKILLRSSNKETFEVEEALKSDLGGFLFRILGYYNGHPLLGDKVVAALRFDLVFLLFQCLISFSDMVWSFICCPVLRELVRKVEQVIPEYDPWNRAVIAYVDGLEYFDRF
ncbi:hypothetical protein QYF36_014624 [Acer negundo]|nr:hypothetical protein QYF36_014624 [Acer negundo]